MRKMMTKCMKFVLVCTKVLMICVILCDNRPVVFTQTAANDDAQAKTYPVTLLKQVLIHRKAKLNSSHFNKGSDVSLDDPSRILLTNIQGIYPRLALSICANYPNNDQSIVNCFEILSNGSGIKFLPAVNKDGMRKHYNRKLLSSDTNKEAMRTTISPGTRNLNSSVTYISEQDLRDIIAFVQQKLSKDPERAIYSVMFLMIVLMVAIKLCGMKPLRNIREHPPDFQDDVHYVGIYDILKMKKPYLPAKILQWNRRIRRKLRKKKPPVRIKEQDLGLGIPGSDTDEETPLFTKVYDF